ncbi:hypothetical protein [Bradyrhizobium manausense]|uniref:Uncharacterized protein n=1 Tax=Bradyrhizobium manausense TaxID=989370 RepID=A0A0R3D0P2_9BRAD|nr:hypothetical protein [Bradyrhizobium manausense]KRQ03267.1 hypothetical protein AOQ71_31560 [Bradyrhizobium manausense]
MLRKPKTARELMAMPVEPHGILPWDAPILRLLVPISKGCDTFDAGDAWRKLSSIRDMFGRFGNFEKWLNSMRPRNVKRYRTYRGLRWSVTPKAVKMLTDNVGVEPRGFG